LSEILSEIAIYEHHLVWRKNDVDPPTSLRLPCWSRSCSNVAAILSVESGFDREYTSCQSADGGGERGVQLLDTKIEVTSAATTKRPHGPGRIEFELCGLRNNTSSARLVKARSRLGCFGRDREPFCAPNQAKTYARGPVTPARQDDPLISLRWRSTTSTPERISPLTVSISEKKRGENLDELRGPAFLASSFARISVFAIHRHGLWQLSDGGQRAHSGMPISRTGPRKM